MILFGLRITNDQWFRLLFHVLFWGMLLAWPFINASGNDDHWNFLLTILPVSLTNIPLFFINSEILVPRVLRHNGVGAFLVSIAILMVFFGALQYGMKGLLLEPEQMKRNTTFVTFMFVTLVTGVSTGYGFITYLVDQEKARQEERQQRLQAELSFLRSQISPHFIFNILNSIVYLIRTKSPQAEPVTIKLSELMRYMLYESRDAQVPLARELTYLENYVALQQMRFEEDVDIRLRIDGQAESQLIEPMLLIPFVENAFKHGVGLIAEPIIDIHLTCTTDELYFSVKNKIAPESAEDKDFSSGIGLPNVTRRLELLYPNAHQLTITNDGEWFVAHLTLRFSPRPATQSIAVDTPPVAGVPYRSVG